ncbi:MAG: MBL fold metallo-hydrolase [Deltaproteobacteria bacterium]|nr:MBL fold metallo-hydrolase [Deltaproteobacteria bacterium]
MKRRCPVGEKEKALDKIHHFGPVWFVPGRNRGKYPRCHSIYIEGAGILIDPASDKQILTQLREGPGVREVWLSHWHEDHLAYLDLFDDLPLKMSSKDAPPLTDIEIFLDWYGMDEAGTRQAWRKQLREYFHYRPRVPSGFLTPGETINLETVTVEVLATPGHTPGHLSFFFKEPEVLFLGDYDLTPFGPYYGELHADIQAVRDSVEYLSHIPAKVWLTSHETGVFTQNPGPLWQQFLEVIDQREAKLIEFLARPRTREEIINAWIAYRKPRQPIESYMVAEWAIMKKHLERLIANGRAKEDQGYFSLN